MPRKRPPYVPHSYSVWVDFVDDAGNTTSTMLYHGSSEFSALLRFAEAVIEHEHAYSIEVRKDGRTWRRVKIEQPPAVP
jgi:hypothetical protein